MTQRREIAVFDFDGTLARRGSLARFLIRVLGFAPVIRTVFAEWRCLIGNLCGTVSADDYKAMIFSRLLSGCSVDRIRRLGAEYADDLLRSWLHYDMVKVAEEHRRRGHERIIVSGSLAVYLDPIGAALDFDAVYSVRLELDPSGRELTGAMEGGNVRGQAKVAAVQHYVDGDEAEIWAYGDSSGDRQLLAYADHPVWVGRRTR